MTRTRWARPVERWRGRLDVARPRPRLTLTGFGSYLKALGAGGGVTLVVALLSLGADDPQALEWFCTAVVIGTALVAVLFVATPMRNRTRHLYYDSMSDRPLGEHHQSAMSQGLTVTLHAVAFAAPAIAVLVYRFVVER